jgi:hypothetical protein
VSRLHWPETVLDEKEVAMPSWETSPETPTSGC